MGIAALSAGIVCWGVTPVLLRSLTPFIDPWTANAIRYPLAAILYWPLLVSLGRRGKLSSRFVGQCFIPAVLSFGGQVFWALAHYELPATLIGFVVRLSAAWAIIGSMLLFHDERQLLRQSKFYVGLALIMAGFLLMTLLANEADGAEQTIPTGNYTLGVIFAVLASTFFGWYIVSVRYFLPTVHPMHSFGVVSQFVSLGVIVGLFAYGDISAITKQSIQAWVLLISSSLLGIACGHVLVYTAVQRLGASITSSCQSLLPFATAAIAYVFLGERLSRWQWIGGFLMIAGAMLLLSIKNRISLTGKKA